MSRLRVERADSGANKNLVARTFKEWWDIQKKDNVRALNLFIQAVLFVTVVGFLAFWGVQLKRVHDGKEPQFATIGGKKKKDESRPANTDVDLLEEEARKPPTLPPKPSKKRDGEEIVSKSGEDGSKKKSSVEHHRSGSFTLSALAEKGRTPTALDFEIAAAVAAAKKTSVIWLNISPKFHGMVDELKEGNKEVYDELLIDRKSAIIDTIKQKNFNLPEGKKVEDYVKHRTKPSSDGKTPVFGPDNPKIAFDHLPADAIAYYRRLHEEHTNPLKLSSQEDLFNYLINQAVEAKKEKGTEGLRIELTPAELSDHSSIWFATQFDAKTGKANDDSTIFNMLGIQLATSIRDNLSTDIQVDKFDTSANPAIVLTEDQAQELMKAKGLSITVDNK